MGTTSENKPKRYISIGLLAHVDSGKTTLSEGMLYLTGQIRQPGRVDHGDAFLDNYALERQRGITIFSKQAVFRLGDSQVTLLDTPGHVDFSAEMERTLQVLDYAILVVSGADGVQGHTRTLWNLLVRYRIPTFIFVNKMDQPGTDKALILKELKKKLDASCVDMEDQEDIATGDEHALEEYLEEGEVSEDTISQMIVARQIFPCYFGAALKLQGVQELLDGIEKYAGDSNFSGCGQEANLAGQKGSAAFVDCGQPGATSENEDKSGVPAFGARVYKISRDPQGNRLTHMKITSGELKVKSLLKGGQVSEPWEEKVDQIRIYSGEKFETVQQAKTGMLCAVTGLKHTFPGEGLGTEAGKQAVAPMLEPVLNYQVYFPEQVDAHTMLGYMRQIEEEDPMLRVIWNEELGEIHVQLMGEVQTEILKSLVSERFGVDVSFGTGNIVYKETIKNVVEGVGHYEPLRHYAEVHLILEPGLPGSGLVFATDCSTDDLDLNWQRLILTHLLEREHRGVLTGAAITDMKITLVAGRAHLKHTEGGDFRQSTYRAVRQGLMQAENVLLEPYYEFRLEVPSEMIGRALTDVQRMYGEFTPPETDGEMSILTGSAPVACMRDYQKEVVSYTRGRGRLTLVFQGYAPCHNTEEVLENAGYDPEADTENPTGSIFCSHGAGYYVPWHEVPEHMHISSQLERYLRKDEALEEMYGGADGSFSGGRGRNGSGNGSSGGSNGSGSGSSSKSGRSRDFGAEDRELEEIFMRTYGKIERRKPGNGPRTVIAESKYKEEKPQEKVAEYLLVDGYNVIFAWDELKELAKVNIESARNKLMDILSNYQGFKKCTVILVFDAYKVDGDTLEIQKYHNIHVVYTKQAETADQYIEKVVHHIGRKRHVTVVTSDGVEQVVTQGQGSALISSREFYEEVEITRRQIQEEIKERTGGTKNYLFDHMDEAFVKEMEDIRLGKKEI